MPAQFRSRAGECSRSRSSHAFTTTMTLFKKLHLVSIGDILIDLPFTRMAASQMIRVHVGAKGRTVPVFDARKRALALSRMMMMMSCVHIVVLLFFRIQFTTKMDAKGTSYRSHFVGERVLIDNFETVFQQVLRKETVLVLAARRVIIG